jgi:hypothetical protein
MRGRSACQLARRARIVQELRNSSMLVARSRRPTGSPAVVEALAVTVRGEIELNGEATARAGTRTAAAKTRSVAIRGHPKGTTAPIASQRRSSRVAAVRGSERRRRKTSRQHGKITPEGFPAGQAFRRPRCHRGLPRKGRHAQSPRAAWRQIANWRSPSRPPDPAADP